MMVSDKPPVMDISGRLHSPSYLGPIRPIPAVEALVAEDFGILGFSASEGWVFPLPEFLCTKCMEMGSAQLKPFLQKV